MSAKQTDKNLLQYIGIGLFSLALAIFVASLTLSEYQLDLDAVKTQLGNDYHYSFLEQEAQGMASQSYSNSFAFLDAFREVLDLSLIHI